MDEHLGLVPLTLAGVTVCAEMEAMQAAGMTPMQVLVASTRNGARAMRRDDLGTIEEGKIADVLVVPQFEICQIQKTDQSYFAATQHKETLRRSLMKDSLEGLADKCPDCTKHFSADD